MFCILSCPHHPPLVCKMNVIRRWNGLDDTAKWPFSRDEMHHFSWFNKIRWRVKELSMEGEKKGNMSKINTNKKKRSSELNFSFIVTSLGFKPGTF